MDILHTICEALISSGYGPKRNEPEYIELMDTYEDDLEELYLSLNPDQQPLFFKTEAQRNLIAAMDEDRMFRFGFQSGAKLILELLPPQTNST